MFNLRAVHKTGLTITEQNVLRRTFRTRGHQPFWTVARSKKKKNKLLDIGPEGGRGYWQNP